MNQVKNKFLKNSKSSEMLEFVQLINDAENVGLLVEVIYTALEDMRSCPTSTPLLSMQIASNDWDV